jgi:hypothetical protein
LFYTFRDVLAPVTPHVLSPLARFDQGHVLLGLGDRPTADPIHD